MTHGSKLHAGRQLRQSVTLTRSPTIPRLREPLVGWAVSTTKGATHMRIESGTTARWVILSALPALLVLATGCSRAAQDQAATRHDSTPIDSALPDSSAPDSAPRDTLRHPIGDPGHVPRPSVTVPPQSDSTGRQP